MKKGIEQTIIGLAWFFLLYGVVQFYLKHCSEFVDGIFKTLNIFLSKDDNVILSIFVIIFLFVIIKVFSEIHKKYGGDKNE